MVVAAQEDHVLDPARGDVLEQSLQRLLVAEPTVVAPPVGRVGRMLRKHRHDYRSAGDEFRPNFFIGALAFVLAVQPVDQGAQLLLPDKFRVGGGAPGPGLAVEARVHHEKRESADVELVPVARAGPRVRRAGRSPRRQGPLVGAVGAVCPRERLPAVLAGFMRRIPVVCDFVVVAGHVNGKAARERAKPLRSPGFVVARDEALARLSGGEQLRRRIGINLVSNQQQRARCQFRAGACALEHGSEDRV